PEEAKPEALLLVGNAERQLGKTDEAEKYYRLLIEKYPSREEAKDARYQRLINVYNTDPSALIAQVDDFLKTSPTPERADQAKLLKAEALYKQQNYAEAAPVYEELRASQLSPKLRAEAAYKLGWCYIQLKDTARVIEAFSYLIKAFPDNPQGASALVQRAHAYQESKNLEAAIGDLNSLIANYPNAKEREAAFQQKALLLGELGRDKEMAQTFQQLLKEYPKTAAAAQANYFIGKTAFDARDYKRAIAPLDNARRLDRAQYYELATSRILLCYFQQHDRKAATREADAALAANEASSVLPDVLYWLGVEYYNDKNLPLADKYFTALGEKETKGDVKPDFWFYLGDVATREKNFEKAESAYSSYLQVSTDAAGKAKAMLALGATKISANKPDDAEKIANEIMQMQPEGKVNAEARLLAGDAQFARQHFAEAGKAYSSVALLYDDPAITPRALDLAQESYRRAGMQAEAERVGKQLRERFPNYVRS
ncbi:MAG: tetratricopeptide repeat protein, partial [Verrucomicrobiota bacterium]|nr:tetratricopeptide repeat protein [Verrucomicrobiota bacterium]